MPRPPSFYVRQLQCGRLAKFPLSIPKKTLDAIREMGKERNESISSLLSKAADEFVTKEKK